MTDAAGLWRDISRIAAQATGPVLDIDLAKVTALDGAVMSLLVEMRARLVAKGIRCGIVGAPELIRPLVHLYHGDEALHASVPHTRDSLVDRIRHATRRWTGSFRLAVTFAGEVTASVGMLVRQKGTGNWRALPGLIERAGTDGIPIVLLLNFLVGFVMGFQSAHQLKLYGANIFVADVVGISVTRELTPLMTAIIMSGRSGAAFAAELGTMKVSEEIDALRTMGFVPGLYLVLPRILALAVVAPVLTLLGDIVAVSGGVVVAVSSLGVTPRGYLAELRTAVVPSDVWTGLAKSFAFGIAIAFIGCQQGFATRGAAEGVGRGTTSTVATCLFTIVVVDTLFTVLFRVFGA